MNYDSYINDNQNEKETENAYYEEMKSDFIEYNDWASGINEEEKDKLILHLLTHGLSRKEAEDYYNRNIEIANFFLDNPTAGYTFVKGNMITYGKKANTSA